MWPEDIHVVGAGTKSTGCNQQMRRPHAHTVRKGRRAGAGACRQATGSGKGGATAGDAQPGKWGHSAQGDGTGNIVSVLLTNTRGGLWQQTPGAGVLPFAEACDVHLFALGLLSALQRQTCPVLVRGGGATL